MSKDTSKPEFWDARYAVENMPWDFHGVPERVKQFLGENPPGRVLIPGCGSAYEVAAFHAADWAVTAVDFSPAAVERARRLLGPLGNLVQQADFFQHPFGEGAFDVVYERTFLCALPLNRRPDYAARMRQILKPGGRLAGFFLYGVEPDPPPNPLTAAEAEELFARDFIRARDEAVADSPPVFAGKERWQEWRRI